MISHVVLFRPKPDLSNADREGLVAAFERAVRDIPTVRGVWADTFSQSQLLLWAHYIAKNRGCKIWLDDAKNDRQDILVIGEKQ